MGRGLRGAKPAREWPKPLEGIEATRHYMYAFIASLKDCGHRPEHVKQVMRELLGRASIGDTPAPQSTEGGEACETEQDCAGMPWCRINGKCQRAHGVETSVGGQNGTA